MFGSPRTPSTPVTGRPSIAAKRASGTPSSLRSVKRAGGVPRGRQSLAPSSLSVIGGGGGVGSPNVASAQRRLPVANDGSHVTEAYGSSLPVLLTEVLSSLTDGSTASPAVRIDSSGWVILISGCRLLLWKFVPTTSQKALAPRELSLPPSTLPHKAELISLSVSESSVSCMAVTPEGSVSYWPDIAHASHCVETTIDVTGEACTRLVSIDSSSSSSDSRACVLATGNATLYLITSSHGVGGISLIGRQVQAADVGFLRGVSRRVSTFIWGASQPMRSGIGADFRAVVAAGKTVFLLGGNTLQKWNIGVGVGDSYAASNDELLCELDLSKLVGDCFAERFWGQDAANMPGIRVWLVDMCLTRNGVLVLAAGTDVAANSTVHYAVATVNPEKRIPDDGSSPKLSSFLVTGLTSHYSEDGGGGGSIDEILAYKMILPDPAGPMVYLHNGKEVVCAYLSQGQPIDKVEFYAGGDRVLGAGAHLRTCLTFSALNGLLAVTPIRPGGGGGANDMHSSMFMETDAMSMSGIGGVGAVGIVGGMSAANMTEMSGFDLGGGDATILNTSMSTEDMAASADRSTRLKAAFALCCKQEAGQAQQIVEQLFPSSVMPGQDSLLDTALAGFSRELIDDYPASDPRWAESRPMESVLSGPGMATASLLLLYQLEDKHKVHNLLLGFLKSIGLWGRMSTVTNNSRVLSTRHLLCEHAEKLIATMALRQHHQSFPVLIDAVIAKVLEKRRATPPMPHLTNQDVFFREVSKIEEFLLCLTEHVTTKIAGETDGDELVSLLSSANTIVYSMLSSAVTYRTSNGLLYAPAQGEEDPMVEVQPWTTSTGSKGLRTLLIDQHKLTVSTGVALTKDPQMKAALVQQLVDVADLILTEYSNQLESLETSHACGGAAIAGKSDRLFKVKEEFVAVRKKLITPLMDLEFYEKASSLAEKYADFETLIQVCEKSNNDQRLHRYIAEFASRGFSDFLYQYYLNKGQKGKLLQQPAAYHNHVNKFLNEHSDLSWLHDIRTNSYGKATATLRSLALKEEDYFGRKKSMLSIAKLCALASDEPQQIINEKVEAIADEQAKMLHQETLPQCILDHLGESTATMKVMPPEELISLYVSEFNEEATEEDFKKALDLVLYMQQDGASLDKLTASRLLIWRQALLRDDWSSLPVDDPLESFKTTMFSRMLESLLADGENLKEIVPSIEVLSQQEEISGMINENKGVEFILRAGFEHVQRVLAAEG